MPTELSHRHAVANLNGEEIEGWANEDPPIEFAPIDLSRVTYGKDGTMYVESTAMQGGDVTFKLLPTSRSAKWLMGQKAEIDRGLRLLFHGSYGDPGVGTACQLRGGVLRTAPQMLVPGVTAEFVFSFEQVVSNNDGADFDPPPSPPPA